MPASNPIRFESGRPMLLAGIRHHHSHAEAARGIPQQWQQFKTLLPLPGQVGEVSYGAICGHDAGSFEYLCGAEVASFDGLPSTLGRMRIDTQQYAVFAHNGPISSIAATWEGIYRWLETNGQYQSAHKPDFERYDRRYDPASASGEVEIWISVAPR